MIGNYDVAEPPSLATFDQALTEFVFGSDQK
jgi:hypothetical protein